MSIEENLFFKQMKKTNKELYDKLISKKPKNIYTVSSKTFTDLHNQGIISSDKDKLDLKSEKSSEKFLADVKPTQPK